MNDHVQMHIDEISTALTNNEIAAKLSRFLASGKVISDDKESAETVELLGLISDARLLAVTVTSFRNRGMLKSDLKQISYAGYNEAATVKIKASLYSLMLLNEMYCFINENVNSILNPEYFTKYHLQRELPGLYYSVKDGLITHNAFEIVNVVQRKLVINAKELADLKPFSERKNFINELIADLNERNYISRIGAFQPHIDYLKTMLNIIPAQHLKKNKVNGQFSEYFCHDGYELFLRLLEKDIPTGNGRKSEIAYCYRRMFSHDPQFIHANQEKFKTWFEKEFQEKEPLGKFRTLDQLRNRKRDNYFMAALDWLNSNNEHD